MLRAKYKFRNCVYAMPKFSTYLYSTAKAMYGNIFDGCTTCQHGYISKGKVKHDYHLGTDTLLYYYTIYDLLLLYCLYR